IPPRRELPGLATDPQYPSGDPHTIHNKAELRYLRKHFSKYKMEYITFEKKLEEEILEESKLKKQKRLKYVGSLEDLPSAFHAPSVPPTMVPSKPQNTGPKFVQFVYVAAHPSQFPPGLRVKLDCYLQDGGRDWKPYFPEKPRPIRSLVENIASGDNLD